MRTITTPAGTPIDLDGDVLAVIEVISRDLIKQKGLDYTFEDVDQAFDAVVALLNDEERRTYLKESLFMSFNRYETERLMEVVKKAKGTRPEEGAGT